MSLAVHVVDMVFLHVVTVMELSYINVTKTEPVDCGQSALVKILSLIQNVFHIPSLLRPLCLMSEFILALH